MKKTARVKSKHSLQQLPPHSAVAVHGAASVNEHQQQSAVFVATTTHVPHHSLSSNMKLLNKQTPKSYVLSALNNSNNQSNYHQHHHKKKLQLNPNSSCSSHHTQRLGGSKGKQASRSATVLDPSCQQFASRSRGSASTAVTTRMRPDGFNTSSSASTGIFKHTGQSNSHLSSPTKIISQSSTYCASEEQLLPPPPPPPRYRQNNHRYATPTQMRNSVIQVNSSINPKYNSQLDTRQEEVDDYVDYKLYETLFKNRRKFSISYGVYETQGFRQSMEDEHFFVRNMDIFAAKPTGLRLHCAFGIFDGHCGKDAATFCKENLCQYIGKSKSFFTNTEKACQEGFLACDDALRKCTEEEEQGSPFAGCTANIAIIRDNVITVANCGDSRSVLAHAGKAVPMSEDHKPCRPDEKRRIEALGGSVQFGRVGGLLAVSRAFGDFEYKSGGKNLVTALPDVKSYLMQRNTDFIIVACDGLWDVITSGEAVKLTYQWLLETGDLTKVCEKLVDLAIERKSMDNVTCMLVAFHELTNNNTTNSLGSHKC